MPLFNFKCSKCEKLHKKLLSIKGFNDYLGKCDYCDGDLIRSSSKPSLQSKATSSEYRKKSFLSDTKSLADDRTSKHFKDHELPRIINEKGIEYAINQGYCDKDGKPK